MLFQKIKFILCSFVIALSVLVNICVQAETLPAAYSPFTSATQDNGLSKPVGSNEHNALSPKALIQSHCERADSSAGWEWYMTNCVLLNANKPVATDWKAFITSKKNIMGDRISIRPLLSIKCPPYSWAVNNYDNNMFDVPDPSGNYWRFDATIPAPLPPVPLADSNWDRIEATYNPDNTADFRCRNSRVPLGEDGWFIALRRDTVDDYFTSCMLDDGVHLIKLKNDGSVVTITNVQARLICVKNIKSN